MDTFASPGRILVNGVYITGSLQVHRSYGPIAASDEEDTKMRRQPNKQ